MQSTMLPSLERVESRARQLASHSWEYGVVFEALLELHNPEFSVFAKQPAFFSNDPLNDVEAIKCIRDCIQTDSATLIDGEGK